MRSAVESSPLGQRLQVALHALCQRLQVVAAFQKTDEASAAILLGHVLHQLRQVAKVLGRQTQRADRVGRMRVEPAT